ncbi:MAG: UDP-N-acetylmuramoyl-L-alanine--D-glutamate ligase [Pirellulales bacterium]|nr:UDP-N-acetylmuramoyl-L-alanine--D-glutamate ligase [Pirellulales bacterium]
MDWAQQCVVVLGLGTHGGGVGAARYLSRCGARVIVADRLPVEALGRSVTDLADCPAIEWRLGGYTVDDLLGAQAVVVNPAVRPDDECLAALAAAGIRRLTEIDLFLQACPAPIVGVTGTTGKSSTTAMLAAMLTADGRRTWQGGNLGGSLLDDVAQMTRDDWVVLELSSFQLFHLEQSAPRFAAAVVTNCTPNHLDWHPDAVHYAAAKQRLLRLIQPRGFAVLDPGSAGTCDWRKQAAAPVVAAWQDDRIPALRVPGAHQRRNAACAAAVAAGLGCSRSAIERALGEFRGLPHRLQWVAEFSGREFFDDSKSTTPAATLAAVEAVSGQRPVWLLLGGVDKGGDFANVVPGIVEHVAGVALFGACRDAWYQVLQRQRREVALGVRPSLAEAFAWCVERAPADGAIVLSPGCASWDQFADYRARGAAFVALVHELAARENSCRALSASLESSCPSACDS